MPRERWNEPEQVADHLVAQRLLTRFQAERLVAGKTLGLVLGNFHILEPIGKGGISVVYKARDVRTGEIIALKTFLALAGPRRQSGSSGFTAKWN